MLKTVKSYHHGDLRATLLNSAETLLSDLSLEAVSLREVAKHAGVSPNAPYRHFLNKEALLSAVAARGFQRLNQRFSAHAKSFPTEKLTGLLTEYLEFARESPGIFRVMFGTSLGRESCDPELASAASECFQILRSSIHPFQSPKRTFLEQAKEAVMVWSLIHGRTLLELDGALNEFEGPSAPDGADLACFVSNALQPAE